MKVLLLSDTHGYLDEAVLRHAREADEIWHAGDIGNSSVAVRLQNCARLRGVFGNIDGQELRISYPEHICFSAEGLKTLMIHIGGYPGNYARGVKELLTSCNPGLFICGHSHILRITRDPKFGDMLCINPGAAGISGFHQDRTMVRFKIVNGAVGSVDVINLGPKKRLE